MNRPKLNAVFGPKASAQLKETVNFAIQIANAASGEWMETCEVILHHHPKSPRNLITERHDKNTLRVRDSHTPPSDRVPLAVIVNNTDSTMATPELQLIHDFAEQFAEMRREWNALPEIDGSETSLEKLQEFAALLNAGVANELMDKACEVCAKKFEQDSFHEKPMDLDDVMVEVGNELCKRGFDAAYSGFSGCPTIEIKVNAKLHWQCGTANENWGCDLNDEAGHTLHNIDTDVPSDSGDVQKIAGALALAVSFLTSDRESHYRQALDRIRCNDDVPDKREDMRDALDRAVLIAKEAVLGKGAK